MRSHKMYQNQMLFLYFQNTHNTAYEIECSNGNIMSII